MPNPNQSAKIRMRLELFQTSIGCVGAQSKLRRRSGDPPRLSREGTLELTEALRSYAGDAANWVPHRAERGPYTGRGASTVGLFAVTGPAGLVRQSLCGFPGMQILIDPRRHLAAFGNAPDDQRGDEPILSHSSFSINLLGFNAPLA